jgi:hypothetical protein
VNKLPVVFLVPSLDDDQFMERGETQERHHQHEVNPDTSKSGGKQTRDYYIISALQFWLERAREIRQVGSNHKHDGETGREIIAHVSGLAHNGSPLLFRSCCCCFAQVHPRCCRHGNDNV